MLDEPIYKLAIGFLLVLLLLLLLTKRKFNRHKYNWKQAIKVRSTLMSFSGEALEARRISYLRKIDAFVFEELLLYSFQQNGAKIIRNKKYTGDGGIDGKVIDNMGNSLVQAKRYTNHINLQHVKDFTELINNDKWANHGYFVHTGKTGKGVYDVLASSNVTLISGSKLLDLIIPKK